MAEEENFYHELDKKTKHSFCTCQTLAIGFIVLGLIVAGLVATAVKRVATAVMPHREVKTTSQDMTSLQNKLTELATAPGASTNLTITEQELTSLLVTGISKEPNIPLRNVQAEIDPESITLTGVLTEYLKTSVAIELIPKVVNGQVEYELVKIQAGSLAVPSFLTEKITSSLDSALKSGTSQLQGVQVKNINLEQGRMTISGTITGTPPATPS